MLVVYMSSHQRNLGRIVVGRETHFILGCRKTSTQLADHLNKVYKESSTFYLQPRIKYKEVQDVRVVRDHDGLEPMTGSLEDEERHDAVDSNSLHKYTSKTYMYLLNPKLEPPKHSYRCSINGCLVHDAFLDFLCHHSL